MKTLIVIGMIIVIGLAIIGGGFGSFVGNVEEGAEKIENNEVFQKIMNKGKQIVSDFLSDEIKPSVDHEINDKQLEIALRIKELTDKGTSMTAKEYEELETLIQTYEGNWEK